MARTRTTRTPRPSVALRQKLEHAALAGSARYVQDLRGLMRGLHHAVMADLRPFLHLYAGRRQDSLSDMGQRLGHFIGQVAKKVGTFFRRMASTLVAASSEALAELLGMPPAPPSRELLDEAEKDSVALMQKAATAYAAAVTNVLAGAGGQTVEQLESALEKKGRAAESHAGLIARDQTLKLNAKFTREAQQSAGFENYWWLTCRDDKVRPKHKANDAVIFAWSDPSPITGHPGHDPNCRCQPIPYDGPLAPGERV